jgi:hypothetical protein
MPQECLMDFRLLLERKPWASGWLQAGLRVRLPPQWLRKLSGAFSLGGVGRAGTSTVAQLPGASPEFVSAS